MGRIELTIVSVSEIASKTVSDRLAPLQRESLGSLEFNILGEKDLPSIKPSCALVILNLPRWSRGFSSAIRETRESGYAGVIVVLIDEMKVGSGWAGEYQNRKDVVFLLKPYSDMELVGLTRWLLSQQPEKPVSRVHPRYEINEPVEIFDGELANPISCTMVNVSRGGACVEFKEAPPLQVDQVITLKVKVDQKNQPQHLKCRVAWVKSARGTAGLQFTQEHSESTP